MGKAIRPADLASFRMAAVKGHTLFMSAVTRSGARLSGQYCSEAVSGSCGRRMICGGARCHCRAQLDEIETVLHGVQRIWFARCQGKHLQATRRTRMRRQFRIVSDARRIGSRRTKVVRTCVTNARLPWGRRVPAEGPMEQAAQKQGTRTAVGIAQAALSRADVTSPCILRCRYLGAGDLQEDCRGRDLAEWHGPDDTTYRHRSRIVSASRHRRWRQPANR